MRPAPQIALLGEGWAGSSVNTVPFRHHAVLPLEDGWVAAFYDAAGAVALCRLDGAFRLAARSLTPSPVQPHDAHACISLARDAAGDIHAVFGAHASTAWHLRTSADLSRLRQAPRALTHAQRLTYPMLLARPRPDGLALIHREGGSSRGEIRVSRWQAAAEAFVPDETPLLSGAIGRLSAGPYLNRPVPLADGRLALFVVWRLPAEATGAGAVVNVGIDLVFADAALQALTTEDGIVLQPPATPVHGARIWPVPPGRDLINQAGATAGPDGALLAATYWSDGDGIPQYRLLRRGDAGWQAARLSAFRTAFSLSGWGTLPLPHSRPEILVRADGTVLCLFRSAEHGNRLMLSLHAEPYGPSPPRVLVDEDLGHYEPVVDAETFRRDGSLVLFVQACRQGQGDGAQPVRGAPARLFRWDAAAVAGW